MKPGNGMGAEGSRASRWAKRDEVKRACKKQRRLRDKKEIREGRG